MATCGISSREIDQRAKLPGKLSRARPCDAALRRVAGADENDDDDDVREDGAPKRPGTRVKRKSHGRARGRRKTLK